MKKIKNGGTIAALLICAVIFFLGCEEEEEYGSLTIKNLPSVPLGTGDAGEPRHYWYGGVYYDEEITSKYHFNSWASRDNQVADFEYWEKDKDSPTLSHKSPFSLSYARRFGGFLDSGTFLVCIIPAASLKKPYPHEEYQAFMSVTFKRGRATIDFNDMTRYESLPER